MQALFVGSFSTRRTIFVIANLLQLCGLFKCIFYGLMCGKVSGHYSYSHQQKNHCNKKSITVKVCCHGNFN